MKRKTNLLPLTLTLSHRGGRIKVPPSSYRVLKITIVIFSQPDYNSMLHGL